MFKGPEKNVKALVKKKNEPTKLYLLPIVIIVIVAHLNNPPNL